MSYALDESWSLIGGGGRWSQRSRVNRPTERKDHHRPRDETELRVEFTRQDKVRWFSPKVLASTAQRVLLSSSIGDFLDKRELQQAFPGEVPTCDAVGDEAWIDYVPPADGPAAHVLLTHHRMGLGRSPFLTDQRRAHAAPRR